MPNKIRKSKYKIDQQEIAILESLVGTPTYPTSPAAAAAAKLLQSCPTLCDPTDGSPPGSSVPGILQARIREWIAISFSNSCMHAKLLQLCLTLCDPMDSSHQAPLSRGFSRQEYWSGLPFPSPPDLSYFTIYKAQSYCSAFHFHSIRSFCFLTQSQNSFVRQKVTKGLKIGYKSNRSCGH